MSVKHAAGHKQSGVVSSCLASGQEEHLVAKGHLEHQQCLACEVPLIFLHSDLRGLMPFMGNLLRPLSTARKAHVKISTSFGHVCHQEALFS